MINFGVISHQVVEFNKILILFLPKNSSIRLSHYYTKIVNFLSGELTLKKKKKILTKNVVGNIRIYNYICAFINIELFLKQINILIWKIMSKNKKPIFFVRTKNIFYTLLIYNIIDKICIIIDWASLLKAMYIIINNKIITHLT